MTEIKKLKYRGRESISIANNKCKAVFFLEFGAKFVSLVNLENGHEFLWQGVEETHPAPDYDGLYVKNDLCGADDIFPSINSTLYPDHPWEGVKCPAHGELWSIPWQPEILNDTVTFSTHGIRFPYFFIRRISFTDSGNLRFDYRIANQTPFEMPAIWAFHPLFNADSDTEIILPEKTTEIINTLNLNSRLGKPGTVHNWPLATDIDGHNYLLNRFSPDSMVCEKFFINHELYEGSIKLKRKKPGESIQLIFPADKIPYLGIWINQGGLLGQNNIALEPATGSYDDVYIARKFEKCSILPGNGSLEFYIEFKID